MRRVSVLMPYRDAAATVEEAVTSVLDQRGVDVELVAIDDGSRDGGPEIVARLRAARGSKIVMIATGGVGIARALERGLAAAAAPLIARMDADDVSHPDRFARQLDAIDRGPRLAALGTRVRAIPTGAVGAGLLRYVEWQNGLVSPDDHARQIFVEAPLCHPSVLLRRDALEAVGGWRDVPWPEDYDLWLRLDAAGWRMAKLPEVLLDWRHRPERTTFTDPRTSRARLLEGKSPFLARRLAALGRPVVVWGAGKTGKRVARALEPHGVRPASFLDIDPRKIGGTARGVPVVDARAPSLPRSDAVGPDAISARRGSITILVAVGEPGARDIVRARLDAMRFVEGDDYLCAS